MREGEHFRNPALWYYAKDEEAEWWGLGGATREEAILKGMANWPDEPFFICEARRMVPSFSIFDAREIVERLEDSECWGEDGWEGQPTDVHDAELDAALTAVLRAWCVKYGDLAGAQLDMTQDAIRIEADGSDA